MRIVSKHSLVATFALCWFTVAPAAFACDLNSPTDLTCGTSFNPANPLSPNNPANLARNPYSPYFSEPIYADGIFGLFEKNPTIIYPAGPPRTCRQGLDCPSGLIGSLSGQGHAAAVAIPPYPEMPPHRLHRRRHRVAQ